MTLSLSLAQEFMFLGTIREQGDSAAERVWCNQIHITQVRLNLKSFGTKLAQVLVRFLDHGFPFDLRGKTPYTYGSEHLPIGLLICGSSVRARVGSQSNKTPPTSRGCFLLSTINEYIYGIFELY